MSEISASGSGEGPRTARQQVEREQAMVRSYRRGVSARSLAQQFGVTPRRVQQIVRQWDDWDEGALAATAHGHELEQIERTIQIAEQLLEDSALVFSKALGEQNVALQIGALRRREEALNLLTSYQRAAGVLPRNLAAPSDRQTFMALMGRVLEVLREKRVADDVLASILEVVQPASADRPAIEAVAGAAA